MRIRSVIAGLVMVQMSLVGVRGWQGPKKSVWDGVYTKEQAQKGAALYNEKCAKCHGPNAMGADAPPLNDAGFKGDWDGLTLDQLFNRSKDTMPQDAPNTMNRAEATLVTAYLLQQNEMPEGSPLPEGNDDLMGITFAGTKPK